MFVTSSINIANEIINVEFFTEQFQKLLRYP